MARSILNSSYYPLGGFSTTWGSFPVYGTTGVYGTGSAMSPSGFYATSIFGNAYSPYWWSGFSGSSGSGSGATGSTGSGTGSTGSTTSGTSSTTSAFLLTTDTDTFGPSEADAANQTTAADDTFSGTSGGATPTLGSADTLDGGDGTDTANFLMEGDFAGFSTGSMNNIENVYLTNNGPIDFRFDATGVSGVAMFDLNSAGGAIDLIDLGDTDADVRISDQPDSDVQIGFTASAVAGPADDLSVTLNNVGTPENGVSEAPVTVNIPGVEDIHLTATGDVVAKFADDTATSMTALGSGSLKINEVSTALESFDGSGLTGALNLDVSNVSTSNQIDVLKGGSANDSFEATATALNVAPILDGGAGTEDYFNFVGSGTTLQPTATGIEDFVFNTTSPFIFSANNTSGVNSFVGGESLSSTVSITGDQTTSNLELHGNNPNAGAVISSDASSTVNVSVSKPMGGTAAAYTNNAGAQATDAQSTLGVTVDDGMTYTGTISGNSAASSLNVGVDGTVTGATFSATSVGAIQITSIANNSSATVNAPMATQIAVTGDAGFDFTGSTLTMLQQATTNSMGHLNFTGLNFADFTSGNFSGAGGSVTLANLGDAAHDSGININASGLNGLTIGTLETMGQDIVVDADGTLGLTTLGDVNANAGAPTTPGDVSLSFGLQGFAVGTITGDAVTVDMSEAISGVPGALGVNSMSQFSFTGSASQASPTVTVTPTGTSLQVILDGNGSQDDTINVVGVDLTNTTNYTVQGDLGSGTDAVRITSNETTAGVTINGASLTTGSIVGIGGTMADTLTGGGGDDTFTGNAGADILSFAAGGNDRAVLANVPNVKDTADEVSGFSSGDGIDIQAAGEFADLHDSDGDAFTGAQTGVVSTVNLAGGPADLLTANANVLAINADTSSLSTGFTSFATLQDSVDANPITEVGTGSFADGDELVVVWYNTTDSAYEVGIATIAGGNGFDGDDETYESLLQVDSSGTTLAEVASSIDFIA